MVGLTDRHQFLHGAGAHKVADHHQPAGDADSDRQMLGFDRIDDRKAGTHGALGVRLISVWPAEIRQHSVANDSRDITSRGRCRQWRSRSADSGLNNCARNSSGSSCVVSGVESTISQNSTVICRRSAEEPRSDARSASSGAPARSARMATSSRRRSPTEAMPASLRSSAVRCGRTSAEIAC